MVMVRGLGVPLGSRRMRKGLSYCGCLMLVCSGETSVFPGVWWCFFFMSISADWQFGSVSMTGWV